MTLNKFELELLSELAQIEKYQDLRLHVVVTLIRRHGAITKVMAELDILVDAMLPE